MAPQEGPRGGSRRQQLTPLLLLGLALQLLGLVQVLVLALVLVLLVQSLMQRQASRQSALRLRLSLSALSTSCQSRQPHSSRHAHLAKPGEQLQTGCRLVLAACSSISMSSRDMVRVCLFKQASGSRQHDAAEPPCVAEASACCCE